MTNKIVLISDDKDFFEFIRAKLALRKSDELFTFSFDVVPDKLEFLRTSLLIINSESSKEKTLDLLNIFKGTPCIISAFNEDLAFKHQCYKNGAFDYITLLTPDAEFQARLIPGLSVTSLLEKNLQYREILVKSNIVMPNNEVFLNYNYIIDKELEDIEKYSKKAVFMAISPDDKTKFLVPANVIETIILNNIRKNDILMNFASNKYFLLLFDSDINTAQKVWDNIRTKLPQKLYAGFSVILNQKRQQLINEVLNKLHEAISYGKDSVNQNPNPVVTLSTINGINSNCANFKLFRKEFEKKLEQVINPVFYQMNQKYSGKISGLTFEQGTGDGYGTFYIKERHSYSCFKITSPGFSKINIDITYHQNTNKIDAKRITLEPEELEPGLLEDLLEQFILEFKKGDANDT